MKMKRLYLHLEKTDIEKAVKHYHYEDHKPLFNKIYKRLVKQIQPVLYYEYDQTNRNRMITVVSLGSAPDDLADGYQQQEQFLETYAVDCLSMELLSKSYKQLTEIVYREKHQFLERMDFCEAEELITLIPKLKELWGSFPVEVNRAGALLPSKTVVFYGLLGSRACSVESACKTCSNRNNCIFRTTTGENI